MSGQETDSKYASRQLKSLLYPLKDIDLIKMQVRQFLLLRHLAFNLLGAD